jgi:hypothetical protein
MYKIVGADQKEYGPISEEQLRQWIVEGRANGQTITRYQDGPWKPLSTFPEFAAALGSAPPSLTPGPIPPLSVGAAPGTAGPPATNGLAMGGLICSILGLFCCGPLFSTIGLVLSAIALSQIRQNPARYTGRGMAVAGIALALVGYTIFAVFVFTGAFKKAMRRFGRPI